MEKKEQFDTVPRWLIFIGAAILLSAIGLGVYGRVKADRPATILAVINSASFTTEVADTPEKRELGLGKRDFLPPRDAMYFPFPTSRRWIFWMKNMRFPIDVIWIRDGMVVDITKNAQAPHGGIIDRFSPNEPANGVLEVNAGVADEINIKPGDNVLFRP